MRAMNDAQEILYSTLRCFMGEDCSLGFRIRNGIHQLDEDSDVVAPWRWKTLMLDQSLLYFVR